MPCLLAARGEGDDSDRRAKLAAHRTRRDHRPWTRRAYAVRAHRMRRRLDKAFAEIFDIRVQHRSELIAHLGGNDDFARTRQSREARSEIGAADGDIRVVGDKFADLHTHPQLYGGALRHAGIYVLAQPLDVEGGLRGVLHTPEPEKETLILTLEKATSMSRKDIIRDVVNDGVPTGYRRAVRSLIRLCELYREQCPHGLLDVAVAISGRIAMRRMLGGFDAINLDAAADVLQTAYAQIGESHGKLRTDVLADRGSDDDLSG